MRARGVNWIERSARILACASLALAPTLSLAASEEDPWESINRPIFTFNDTLDTYALKPLAQGYQKVTPNFVQDGVHNFFNNLGDVKNLANNLLQAKFHNAGVDTSRLLFNSTFGLAGLIDVATPMGLQRNDEDFGQTLGYWASAAACMRCCRSSARARCAMPRRRSRTSMSVPTTTWTTYARAT